MERRVGFEGSTGQVPGREVVVGGVVVPGVVVVGGVVVVVTGGGVLVPGRHWEYQSFNLVQTEPETH